MLGYQHNLNSYYILAEEDRQKKDLGKDKHGHILILSVIKLVALNTLCKRVCANRRLKLCMFKMREIKFKAQILLPHSTPVDIMTARIPKIRN